MIAADANKSDHITAFDLIEIRKLILGINTRFPNNTSWRFVDRNYSFPDPYNPFIQVFPESIWIDSVTLSTYTADFVGIKIGDVNGSFFKAVGAHIEQRSASDFELELQGISMPESGSKLISVDARKNQGKIDGMQFSLYTGYLSEAQLQGITSDVLGSEQWYYNATTGMIHVSWTATEAEDIGGKALLKWPASEISTDQLEIMSTGIIPEAYLVNDQSIEVRRVVLSGISHESEIDGYQLHQNKPNPFAEGTVISFTLPEAEEIKLVVSDLTGRKIFETSGTYPAGRNDILLRGNQLASPGIYYYTLYTGSVSFTRKMSFTNN